tara:strand:+ start:118 stop:318 length:201 start_codon:yes stop_codon:yes gene_type:complete
MALEDIVIEVGRLGNWIQAVGLVVILWVVVQAVTMFFNRRRRMLLRDIDERLERVEKKLDRTLRKK